MKEITLLLCTAVLAMTIWMWQMEGNSQNVALARGKDAVNYSAHDASMQVIKSNLGQGKVVFDQNQANQVFQDTLVKNLQLNTDLSTKPNTLFSGVVEVVWKDFVDESNVTSNSYIDPSQRFPFDGYGKLYHYTDPSGRFNIQQTITGPAVVYVIKVRKPIQFGSSVEYYYIGTVFEYPFYK